MSYRSLFLSILLHLTLGGVLLFGVQFQQTPTPKTTTSLNAIQAVSVDKRQLELELDRLKQQEKSRQQARLKENQVLEKIKLERQREESRLEQIKKEIEAKKRAEKKLKREKKTVKAKPPPKKDADNKQKMAKKKIPQALPAELNAEEKQKDNAQIQTYQRRIKRSIENEFNRLGLPERLSCIVLIRLLANGQVADVSITQSSGNALFDKRAEDAVYQAQPLPVPEDPRLFTQMRMIRFTFQP